MFPEQEVKEFIMEEFCENNWELNIESKLIDPLMDQGCPKLYEEVDLQEWQKLILLSTPMSVVYDVVEPTCLRVNRVGSGPGYNSGYYNSWGSYDLKEMCVEPAPEITHFDIVKTKPISETELSVVVPEIEQDVKTRIQITLKKQGINVRGHTGNFVVYGVSSANMINMLSELYKSFPKVKKAEQTVRIQFFEYKVDSGEYKSDSGGNMNLHNAEVGAVVAFISTTLVSKGFSLRGREWVFGETTSNGIMKTRRHLLNVKKIIDSLPDAFDINNVPYNDVHKGLWCLCRVRNGHSWVLFASESVSEILTEQEKVDKFTYILSPKGSIHRGERNV
jgi:hypothetical protein